MNYSKIYNNLIKKRQDFPAEEGEIHHIVPRSMGGSNDKSNLVKLTCREHFFAHLLLYKIHRNKEMAFALGRMLNSNKNSRSYEFARKAHRKAVSEWSKAFMSDKVSMRNVKTGKCKLLVKGTFNKDEWVGNNFGNRFEGEKGVTNFKDESGKIYRLKVDDSKINELGLKGIGNWNNATKRAKEVNDSRPWFNKFGAEKESIVNIESLYNWYITNYDESHPKATGVAKWMKKSGIEKRSKLYAKALNMFKQGWKPNTEYYEVKNEILKNRQK